MRQKDKTSIRHRTSGQLQGETQQAEVIAVGGGKVVDGKEVPVQVKPGDRVIYGKYTGTEIKYEGEKYLVINADDIIAIVKD